MKGTSRKSLASRWTLIVLVLFVVVAVVAGTYARYTNTASGTATVDIAKWSVKIDGSQMSEISSGAMPVPLTYATNANVSNGKLAPGRSATFTLVIDPTDSEVAIDYNIALGAITGLTDTDSAVALTSATYTVEGEDPEDATISAGAGTISFTEGLADVEAGKTVTVVGTITWTDVAANNAADTANGLADQDLSATVTITASQHI